MDNVIDKWSPALQIRTVLLSIQALMGAPNPDDPLANDVAQHWKSDEKDAIETGTLAHYHIILTDPLFYSPGMDKKARNDGKLKG